MEGRAVMGDGAGSELNLFLRALAHTAAALVVGAGICALVLRLDSSPADTGPVLRLVMWCALIELTALGAGAFLAARRAPRNTSPQTVLAAGIVASLLLALVVILMAGPDGGGLEVAVVAVPIAVAVFAFGAMAGRR